MDSLLDALQEGRLLELPGSNKDDALRFLAHVLEAVPTLPPRTDIAGIVLAKDRTTVTALGHGWACPDARVPFHGDLICVVGWSPDGIDYAAADGAPVRFLVMYLVPDNQRSQYLREMSMLAKALELYPGRDALAAVTSLAEVRDGLLDLIDSTKAEVGPDARARMIRLRAKAGVAKAVLGRLSDLVVEPLTIVAGPGFRPVVLGQDSALVTCLDQVDALYERLAGDGSFDEGEWRVVRRGQTSYHGDRSVFDCLAIRGSAAATEASS